MRNSAGAGPVWMLVLGLLVPGARAQARGDAPRQQARLVAGTEARVTRAGFQAVGELLPGTPTTLHLQPRGAALLEVPLVEVERLEVKRRHGGTGALVGAVAGGLGLGGYAAYHCGYRSDPGGVSSATGCGLVFGSAGAVGGALLGLVTGMMVSSWETAWARAEGGAPLALQVLPDDEPWTRGGALDLGLKLGGAWRTDASRLAGHESGPGAQLQLLAQLGPYFAVGPELAYYAFTDLTPGPFQTEPHQRQLLRAGGVGRLGLPLGRVRPALLAGAGLYQLSTDLLTGYSAGAEVEVRPGTGGLALALEARVHRVEDINRPTQHYVSAGLGAGWRW